MKLKNLCLKLFKQRKKVKEINDKLSLAKDKKAELENLILDYLTKKGLKRFDSGEGLVSENVHFDTGVSNKQAFAAHLKKYGRLEELMTFNSKTVNAYYKEELERAKAEGRDMIKIDGLRDPVARVTLSVRGGK